MNETILDEVEDIKELNRKMYICCRLSKVFIETVIANVKLNNPSTKKLLADLKKVIKEVERKR